MGGGLMQLVAYGAQDMYLTGNPQITYFKVVHRRHTNFSMESIEQTFNSTPNFGKTVTCTVSRNGDLLHKVYLQCDLPTVATGSSGFSWVTEIGFALIDNIEIEIGGQIIDKHYNTWLSIWNSLTLSKGHLDGFNELIGNVSSLHGVLPSTPAATGTNLTGQTLYIPLQFWFNRNPGLALPLIALQYHEVKFNVKFSEFSTLSDSNNDNNYVASTPVLGTTTLWCDYIYLDTDERRRFAQIGHEYLIEQVQFSENIPLIGSSNNTKLTFNHPVKELIWVVQNTTRLWNNFTDKEGSSAGHVTDTTPNNPILNATLQFNGHDRFTQRSGTYFNCVQPYQHHSNIPVTGINVYSFAFKPEEHQPSGSANMSRIDSAILQTTLTTSGSTGSGHYIKIYAVNYNVLRVMGGMGGLAYSN